MTLYEIDKQLQDLIEQAVDPETGELAEGTEQALADLEMQRAEKVENIALFVKNLKADAAAIREEEKALAARRQSAERKAERLQNYLMFALEGQKFNTARVTISYRHSQRVVLAENRLADVPEEYLRYKEPELDKTAVKKAILSGIEVPGCALEDNTALLIK